MVLSDLVFGQRLLLLLLLWLQLFLPVLDLNWLQLAWFILHWFQKADCVLCFHGFFVVAHRLVWVISALLSVEPILECAIWREWTTSLFRT